jgi:hypothetical protein
MEYEYDVIMAAMELKDVQISDTVSKQINAKLIYKRIRDY